MYTLKSNITEDGWLSCKFKGFSRIQTDLRQLVNHKPFVFFSEIMTSLTIWCQYFMKCLGIIHQALPRSDLDLPSVCASAFFPILSALSQGLFSLKFPSFLNFFNVFIFKWKISVLQCCVGFCHTSAWISQMYTYVPSLLNLPLTLSCPFRLSESSGFELPMTYSKFPLPIYFTYGIVYVSMLFS